MDSIPSYHTPKEMQLAAVPELQNNQPCKVMLERKLRAYLVLLIEGSKPEILFGIAQTAAAISRLKIIWRYKNISLASKIKLMRTPIFFTFLYTCESRTREKDPIP